MTEHEWFACTDPNSMLEFLRGEVTERKLRLPQLADALENAGCDSSEVLAHCRQPGEHVRGCWVVDLILGKK